MNLKKYLFYFFNYRYILIFANPVTAIVSYFICISYNLSNSAGTNVYIVHHRYFFTFCFIGMLLRISGNFLCQTRIKKSIYYQYNYRSWLTKFTQQNIISSSLGMIMVAILSMPIEGNVMGFLLFPVFIIFMLVTLLTLISNTTKIYAKKIRSGIETIKEIESTKNSENISNKTPNKMPWCLKFVAIYLCFFPIVWYILLISSLQRENFTTIKTLIYSPYLLINALSLLCLYEMYKKSKIVFSLLPIIVSLKAYGYLVNMLMTPIKGSYILSIIQILFYLFPDFLVVFILFNYRSSHLWLCNNFSFQSNKKKSILLILCAVAYIATVPYQF